MTVDFYYMPMSAPCRSIQMCAAAVGVPLTLKSIDLSKNEHLTDAYLAINPLHTIPCLVDNGFVMTESRAIMGYLVDKYSKQDDSLYPRDPLKRAVVNQRMFFDMGTLYQSFADYYYPVFFGGAAAYQAEAYKKIETALSYLNQFLDGNQFVAGDTLTIADLAIVASVSSFCHPDGVKLGNNYPNVTRWFNKMKMVAPRYDLNVEGARDFKQLWTVFKHVK